MSGTVLCSVLTGVWIVFFFSSRSRHSRSKRDLSSDVCSSDLQIPGIVAIDPAGGKMARVVATSPEFQARNWFVERNGPWTHKVVEQLTMFPNARNVDITDAITQASVWLQANTYELGLLDYFKRLAKGAKKMVASVQELLARKPGTAVEEEPKS